MSSRKAVGKKGRQVTPKTKELLRSLPSVSQLLEHEEVQNWLQQFPRASVLTTLQAALDRVRDAMLAGRLDGQAAIDQIVAIAEEDLVERSIPSIRRVINATGIVLHTGLGRAPLVGAAVEAVAEAAGGYCNLEFDLSTGNRGRRNAHVVDQLASITGAESATVVNNNAAATLLILQTFAQGREVVVSRGQLVEIGGTFRLPDIMSAGGVILHEVGTTNRTRISDYQSAINENTALLLRVHPSNFRVVGFTEEVDIEAIAALAHRHDLIAVDDLGSGAIFNLPKYGLPDEPTVPHSVQAGADLVCFSGDKLLGGPQSGIIVGKRKLIDRLDANPLMRTYRVGKMTLLALEATLHCYLDPEYARTNVPILAMLTTSTEVLAERARALAERLETELPHEKFLVCSDVAYAGGGAMPARELPTVVVQWRPARSSAAEMIEELHSADTPVVARIRDDAICFDLRTVPESDFDTLVESTSTAVWDSESHEETGGTSLPVL